MIHILEMIVYAGFIGLIVYLSAILLLWVFGIIELEI